MSTQQTFIKLYKQKSTYTKCNSYLVETEIEMKVNSIIYILAISAISSYPALAQQPQATKPVPVVGKVKGGFLEGSPADNLPKGMKILTSFGERPVFSPDGTKIAFVGKSFGDAFEYDLLTGKTRNLTEHTPNSGFLRVHYLNDGSFLLLGPRKMASTRMGTRFNNIELWYMDKDASGPLRPLGQYLFEGIATSRLSNRISWAIRTPRENGATENEGYTAMMVGDVSVVDGNPKLENIHEIARKKWSDCYLEPQDFYDNDSKITASCYVFEKPLSAERPTEYRITESKVWSVDVATGALTEIPTTAGLYAEVEGILPDGKGTLVECGLSDAGGLDICFLDLKTDKPRYLRLTNATDYRGYKVSNPVVSPDGKHITMSMGISASEPGEGVGILLMDMPKLD